MDNRMNVFIAVFLGSALALSGAMAAKPEAKWRGIGRKAHPQTRHKTAKAKDQYCTATCRKSGAHKSRDLGACKEGCVFG
jgi:hypothetical protein